MQAGGHRFDPDQLHEFMRRRSHGGRRKGQGILAHRSLKTQYVNEMFSGHLDWIESSKGSDNEAHEMKGARWAETFASRIPRAISKRALGIGSSYKGRTVDA